MNSVVSEIFAFLSPPAWWSISDRLAPGFGNSQWLWAMVGSFTLVSGCCFVRRVSRLYRQEFLGRRRPRTRPWQR